MSAEFRPDRATFFQSPFRAKRLTTGSPSNQESTRVSTSGGRTCGEPCVAGLPWRLGYCGRGFTLIELLFVVLLLGTVMTVIMACFEGGLRVYDRVSGFGSSEMNAYLAGETLSRDLKNAIQTEQLPLTGEPQAMELLTVATVGAVAGQRLQVRYEADASGLLRLTAPPENSDTLVSERVESERLLGLGFAVRLRYQGNSDESGNELGWSDTWTSSSNLPVAVQLEIAGEALPEGPVVRTVLLETAKTGDEQP